MLAHTIVPHEQNLTGVAGERLRCVCRPCVLFARCWGRVLDEASFFGVEYCADVVLSIKFH